MCADFIRLRRPEVWIRRVTLTELHRDDLRTLSKSSRSQPVPPAKELTNGLGAEFPRAPATSVQPDKSGLPHHPGADSPAKRRGAGLAQR
jgi:hypothetical protein